MRCIPSALNIFNVEINIISRTIKSSFVYTLVNSSAFKLPPRSSEFVLNNARFLSHIADALAPDYNRKKQIVSIVESGKKNV